jgi:hypothetical protein
VKEEAVHEDWRHQGDRKIGITAVWESCRDSKDFKFDQIVKKVSLITLERIVSREHSCARV